MKIAALPRPILKPWRPLAECADAPGHCKSVHMRRLEVRCVTWGIYR